MTSNAFVLPPFEPAQKHQVGFTIIELTMMIVIVGILAVIGFGKYKDLNFDLRYKKATLIASSITMGTSINQLSKQAGKPGYSVLANTNVCEPWFLSPFMSPSSWPYDQYTIRTVTSGGYTSDCSAAAGNSMVYCQIQTTSPPWMGVTFPVHCAR